MSDNNTVDVCYRKSVSITDNVCLSQTVCVCHRHSVSVTDSLFVSQTACVFDRQPIVFALIVTKG